MEGEFGIDPGQFNALPLNERVALVESHGEAVFAHATQIAARVERLARIADGARDARPELHVIQSRDTIGEEMDNAIEAPNVDVSLSSSERLEFALKVHSEALRRCASRPGTQQSPHLYLVPRLDGGPHTDAA